MKLFTTSAVATLLAITAIAHPLKRQAAVTDVDILQYALTLEHLENTFYKGAISSMSEADFMAAGFSSAYYNNLKYITHDEEQHVELLSSALMAAGQTPVAACTYDFPYTDPKSFVTLASVLEGVGTSAYLGGAGLITSKAYLGVAGSILVTESLHTSVQRFNLGEVAPANPYGTALGLNPVYTLAAAFITSCPSTNAALPVMAFPTLTATQGIPAAENMTFTFSVKGALPTTFYVVFVSGLSTTSVMPTMQGDMIAAVIPPTAMGQTYVFISKSMTNGTITDAMILYGPAVIEVTPPAPTFDLSEH
ncbi:hypothetical protein HO173_008799 [Letharia columbiana]|uniref:Uncharacterized protein n=1 Tax=Letharia columbiana TaxID=112416 RepID=A0A8H6FQV8_9LECA|nr:uncharacterized protein HO173_008799 [Letharia columbiana]KAF6233043.1 hypothetical protein HO173_008799 [Letharia columbiana]